MKSNRILLALLMVTPTPAFAHPGHDHHATIGVWAALALANLLLLAICRAMTLRTAASRGRDAAT